MMNIKLSCAAIVGALVTSMFSTAAIADPVKLNNWSSESYPAVAGFGSGAWAVAPGGDSVYQSVNGQPTVFVSDFTMFASDVRGRVTVGNDGDDDFFGFVIGYRPGDTSNSAADYLLVDWKQGTQWYDFGSPSTTPGANAPAGLAVSRVTGIPTADEFWGHTNFGSHSGGGVQELARGVNLGDIGYSDNTPYEFQFIFQPNRLEVFVNGSKEIDISGAFADGRMGFYNFSQSSVTYSAFELTSIPAVPEPETYAMMLAGLGLVGYLGRRRKQNEAAVG
jgi:hypothetical protein